MTRFFDESQRQAVQLLAPTDQTVSRAAAEVCEPVSITTGRHIAPSSLLPSNKT